MAIAAISVSAQSCSCSGGILGSALPDSIDNAVNKVTTSINGAVQTLADQSSAWQQTLTNLEAQLSTDANGLETKVASDVHDLINQVDLLVKDGAQFVQEQLNCQTDIFASHATVALKNLLIGFLNTLNYKGINNRPLTPNVPIVCSANPNQIDVAHWPVGTTMVLSGTDLNLFSSKAPDIALIHIDGSERAVPATMVNPMTNYRVSVNVPVMISQNLFDQTTVQMVVRWNGSQVNPNKIAVIPQGPCGGTNQACCSGNVCNNGGTCRSAVCVAPLPAETCTWLAMGCGIQSCGADRHVGSIDFNITPSEGCWGQGDDTDEPTRAVKCCTSGSSAFTLNWQPWGCGVRQCPPGQVIQAVDFTKPPSGPEGCWGAGDDMDEPQRRILCNVPAIPVASVGCFWTGWGCGRMECPAHSYMTAVDFNSVENEHCWGAGNDMDEPDRRIQCCPMQQ